MLVLRKAIILLGALTVVSASFVGSTAYAAATPETISTHLPSAVQAARNPVATIGNDRPLVVNHDVTDKPTSSTYRGRDLALLAYWTPARMRNAIPADSPKDIAVTTKVTPAEQRPTENLSSNAPARVATHPVAPLDPKRVAQARKLVGAGVTNFSPANGKVFFREGGDGTARVCSGTALNSESKRLVITAGHCVYGSKSRKWHTDWIFVPGYHEGQVPFGIFPATTMHTFKDWQDNTDSSSGKGRNSDVAMVSTSGDIRYGDRLVDLVGGHGLVSNRGFGFDATLFAYPGNLNNGEMVWACWGKSGSRRLGWLAYKMNKISGCNFGKGSSGGP